LMVRTSGKSCTLCDLDALRAVAVLSLENDACLFVNSE
jgi:hypothetical protein